MKYDENRAKELLRCGTANSEADFRAGQEDAIRDLIENAGRLLVVQKTGWGKSFVYFIATKLLREAGAGLTILISPLLSLMRNQIAAAERMGVRAATINSSNKHEWADVAERLKRGSVDILLVSPERFANSEFVNDVLPLFARNVALFVVDEAHCVSDWGHDFRPHYRLVRRILNNLPSNIRLLATTATANHRVIQDLEVMLGPDLRVQRGPLERNTLTLQVIKMTSEAERLAWLAHALKTLEGSGIVYVLTVRDAQRVSDWLKAQKINAVAYYSDVESDEREYLEQLLINNQCKALVATTALGMGFDKSDIKFVIHYQIPGSVVAYYQQVGRAGRAVKSAYGVLLYSEADLNVNTWFINSAFPSRREIGLVIEALGRHPNGLSLSELMASVNLSRGRIEKSLSLMELESPAPIVKYGTKYQLTPFPLSEDFWMRADRLTKIRNDELSQMIEYTKLPFGSHMAYLVRTLDGDPSKVQEPNLPPLPEYVPEALVKEALSFVKRTAVVIEPRKMWPAIVGLPVMGLRGSIPAEFRAQIGRALCVWGDVGWGELVRKGKYEDKRFSDDLVDAAVDLIKSWRPDPFPTWVSCIPSLRHPELVPDFAKRVAEYLEIPFINVFKLRELRPEQKTMSNSFYQAQNVDGVLLCDGDFQKYPLDLIVKIDC